MENKKLTKISLIEKLEEIRYTHMRDHEFDIFDSIKDDLDELIERIKSQKNPIA
jgi:hypothetical protein